MALVNDNNNDLDMTVSMTWQYGCDSELDDSDIMMDVICDNASIEYEILYMTMI